MKLTPVRVFSCKHPRYAVEQDIESELSMASESDLFLVKGSHYCKKKFR